MCYYRKTISTGRVDCIELDPWITRKEVLELVNNWNRLAALWSKPKYIYWIT